MNNIDIKDIKHFQKSILSINNCNNNILIALQDYTAFTVNENLELSNIHIDLESSTQPHKYSKVISSSNDFICIPDLDKHIVNIFNLNTSKIVATLRDHNGNISASNFSNDGKYFASGGEDGRIYIYETKYFRKILSLPNRPDYISSIKFSNDSTMIFVSCFDRSNIIFDCKRAITIKIFYTNEVVEWGDFFDENLKLYLILRDSSSAIYETEKHQITNTAHIFTSWPSTFYLDYQNNLAIIGSRDSSVYLVNVQNNTKLFHIVIDDLVGVNAICIFKYYVALGGVSGNLVVANYEDKNNEFLNACNAKDYKKAASMLEANIFLSLQKCAKIFDEDWGDILKKAIILLQEGKIDEAIELTAPFTMDIAKKEAFTFYLNQKDVIKIFNQTIDEKDYKEAYNIALKHKFLNKTQSFENLEGIWQKAFNSAKKMLEEDAHNINNAKKILEPFMRTPKKEIIMNLINNINTFRDSEEFIREQKFKEYFSLTSKFSYLQQTELYKKIINLGNNIFYKALGCLDNNNYDEFYKLANFLKDFPMYKENIISHTLRVDKKLEMINLIKNNDKKALYDLVMEFQELQFSKEFKEFCNGFEELYTNSLQIAFNGEISKLIEAFSDYIDITYWRDKISSIFKIAYLAEFNQKSKFTLEQINWEKSLQAYVSIYGKDDEITSFAKEIDFNLDTITTVQNKEAFRFQPTLIFQK